MRATSANGYGRHKFLMKVSRGGPRGTPGVPRGTPGWPRGTSGCPGGARGTPGIPPGCPRGTPGYPGGAPGSPRDTPGGPLRVILGTHGGALRGKGGASGDSVRLGGPWPSQGPRATALGERPGRPQNRGSEAIFLGFSCEKLQSDAFRLGIRVIF